MSTLMEEITLVNIIDRGFANRGYIEESDIRSLTVEAFPDTGAWTLVINEEIRRKLGLTIQGSCDSILVDGIATRLPITESVCIQWKNRSTELPAVVIANAPRVLLGGLPLEAMDLKVDPVCKQLTGAHGDQPLHILC